MADAAVRPAAPSDVAEIARIQRDTWRTAYAELLPAEILDALDNEQAWREAVEEGTVFVATEGEWTVGFCVAGRAPQPEVTTADGRVPEDASTTALIGTLLVEPRWG